jgi:hypothetical protein
MAEQKPDPKATPETDPKTAEPDAEESFWAKLDEKVKASVNGAIDEKLEAVRQTSASRGTGRRTLPGLIADFVFPPDKSDK